MRGIGKQRFDCITGILIYYAALIGPYIFRLKGQLEEGTALKRDWVVLFLSTGK